MDVQDLSEARPETPSLELAMEVRLRFHPLPKMLDVPAGGSKGVVVVDSGIFRGPGLSGTVVPASGGDFATFRADGVVLLDARYMLIEDDGTPIYLHNRGFVWGRDPGVMPRFSRVAAGEAGVSVDPSEYYFRTMTSFDAPHGKHEWLTRHAFIGAGARLKDGNVVHYYKVT